MSLATRCTHCGSIFKVVQEQLKVSEGWVRCGRCQEIFNALPSLFALEQDPPPPRLKREKGNSNKNKADATAPARLNHPSSEERQSENLVDAVPVVPRQPGEVGILADQGPTKVESLARVDALGRARLTTALAKLLTNRTSTRPMAIGLFGHWGSGKSSQVGFLSSALKANQAPKVRVVEFNAWQHEHADNIGAALAQTMVEFFVSELGFFSQLSLAIRVVAKENARLQTSLSRDANSFVSWCHRWSVILPSLALPFLFGGALSFWLADVVLSTLLTKGLLSLVGGLCGAWLAGRKFISDKLLHWFNGEGTKTEIGRKLGLPDFRNKMGVFHEIHRALSILCELCIKRHDAPTKGEYLLLVVDDLDRCEPSTVKNVLDAVRLVADVERVVTLVAIDERIAFAAVTKHFDKFGFAGRDPELVARDYLAKVFQVAVTLPEIPPPVVGDFIRHELFRDEVPHEDDRAEHGGTEAPILTAMLNEGGTEGSGPMSPDKETAQLMGTLPEEVTAFGEMAAACNFNNPRQLWRVKQAWQLLKGMCLNEGSGMVILRPWMRILFLREHLLQSPVTERISIEAWIANPKPGGNVPSILSRLADGPVETSFVDYEAKAAMVDMVLLPAASPRRAR